MNRLLGCVIWVMTAVTALGALAWTAPASADGKGPHGPKPPGQQERHHHGRRPFRTGYEGMLSVQGVLGPNPPSPQSRATPSDLVGLLHAIGLTPTSVPSGQKLTTVQALRIALGSVGVDQALQGFAKEAQGFRGLSGKDQAAYALGVWLGLVKDGHNANRALTEKELWRLVARLESQTGLPAGAPGNDTLVGRLVRVEESAVKPTVMVGGSAYPNQGKLVLTLWPGRMLQESVALAPDAVVYTPGGQTEPLSALASDTSHEVVVGLNGHEQASVILVNAGGSGKTTAEISGTLRGVQGEQVNVARTQGGSTDTMTLNPSAIVVFQGAVVGPSALAPGDLVTVVSVGGDVVWISVNEELITVSGTFAQRMAHGNLYLIVSPSGTLDRVRVNSQTSVNWGPAYVTQRFTGGEQARVTGYWSSLNPNDILATVVTVTGMTNPPGLPTSNR